MKEGKGKWEEKSNWDKEMYHRVIREGKSKITRREAGKSRSTKCGQKKREPETRIITEDTKRQQLLMERGQRDEGQEMERKAAEREASDLI